VTPAGFQNTKEVILPYPGSGKYCRLKQKIDAWDHATPGNRRVPKGKYLTLQCKGRTSGGQPNGTFRLGLWQWDGAAYTAIKARRRLTDDSIVFDLDGITINGSDMITDHSSTGASSNPIGPDDTAHSRDADASGHDRRERRECQFDGGNAVDRRWAADVYDEARRLEYHIQPPDRGHADSAGAVPDGDAGGRPFVTLQP